MRFFFYGTLMDADVRRAVLRERAPLAVEPAVLRGWRRVPVAGAAFPMLRADRLGRVDGVLARGLDRIAHARLVRYEDADYRMIHAVVSIGARKVPARVFVPARNRLRGRRGHWDLRLWQRRDKKSALARIARRNAAP